MDISKRLKELRSLHHLSQAELAARLNLSPAAIGMYESGARMPKYEILELIADFFNVNIGYLLGQENETTAILTSDKLALLKEFERPEVQMLFSAVKDCTPEEILQIVKIVKALRG